ncbi:hypothetical protein [Actinacidiphila sp. ITFR-21]|uniref:hypothetical protein n=1 Tax=Actinacidiphila sp. ITFR-21 TaxID=3075199 RepID=UPI00288C4168|nr:hypothetical protein [Streptomyces sp. ITFR-21]WNI17902.1 hypothetical protein RLT57_21710 [Streptomyces sp. ITFR-21]
MAALVWLLIPVAAAVLAGLWGRWAARRRVTGDGESLAGYERFRTAMEAGLAPGAPDVGQSALRRPVRPVPRVRDGSRRRPERAVRESVPRGAELPGEEDSPRGPVVGPVP